MELDYVGLMELARKKALEEAELLYPFWLHKERAETYERLTRKYYHQYTLPNAPLTGERTEEL